MNRTRPGTGGLAEQIEQIRPTVGDGTAAGARWERTSAILDRFGRFAVDGCGLVDLGEVTAHVARSFVTAPTGAGHAPSISTMHRQAKYRLGAAGHRKKADVQRRR